MSTETKVTTKELVRFSYVDLIEAKLAPGATEAKFKMSIIVPKSAKKTLKQLEDGINAAIELGESKFGDKWGTKRNTFKLPLRDGDDERPGDAGYANSMFFNASNKTRPGVFNAKVQPILDLQEVVSGDWGMVCVTFFPYNVSGAQGVGAALNLVQKVKNGEPLGSGVKASDEFEELDEADFDDV